MAVALAVGAVIGGASPAGATSYICQFGASCETIIVNPGGTGSGTVVSTYTRTQSGGFTRIDCSWSGETASGVCSLIFRWLTGTTPSDAVLTATPGPGSCIAPDHETACQTEGTAYSYRVQLINGEARAVNPRFLLTTRTLSVTSTGDGTGSLDYSLPGHGGGECTLHGLQCVIQEPYGTTVSLIAKPDAGAVFKAWTGACAGQGATCKLTLDSAYPTVDVSTNVVFGLAGPSPSATPKPVVTPKPVATPQPSGQPPATSPSASAAEASLGSTQAATEGPSAASSQSQSIPLTQASSSDSGVPGYLVIVIAVLALLVGALGLGLILAVRRRPS
jgi:hypothetical protein